MATLVHTLRSSTPKSRLSSIHLSFRRRSPAVASFSDQVPSSISTTIKDNPLLKDFKFPPFDVIDASHVRPGMRALLKKLDNDLTELEKTVEPTWLKLSEPLERIIDRLSVVWGAVNHLKAVKDTPELRSAIEEIQELAKLSKKYGENIMDATKKYRKLITDKKEIEGLPATARGFAAQTASSEGHENATAENGPWMITLDAPSFVSVIQHAKNRALREEIYRVYVTRASSGDLDNTPIIDQILKLSMATKMATVGKAEELLEKLRSASWNAAVQDMEELKEFVRSQGAPEADELTHWDITFWSERLRESKYEIHEVPFLFIPHTNSQHKFRYLFVI
ncbi:Neurolysin/Thimet oligopeptidase, domain 2 [Cynara cardunculus var. scolymus]|uniref:Neurolysin/Thimet oligopeptidase, domain 2 n=1 Tax=Cynara cardunculus var. scolymus TaxID=59895 RepID=A0A103Y579_CYNCS|nr:Neurolysin/Thimet oligopeptidase, domain 2 [Cynara cardunculus var. scolymus]